MDDDELRWMTYDEAASALRIKSDSVRRRAAARKWPRRIGNDGLARIGIPPAIIPDRTPAPIPEITPVIASPDPDEIRTIQEELGETKIQLAASRAEAEGLRARLADTQAERDRLAGLLERALQHRRGFLSRLFAR